MNIESETRKLLQMFGYNPDDFKIIVIRDRKAQFATAGILLGNEKPVIKIKGGPTSLARLGLAMLLAHELAHYEVTKNYPELLDKNIDQHELKEFQDTVEKLTHIIIQAIMDYEETHEPTT